MIEKRSTLLAVVKRGDGKEEALVRDNEFAPYYVVVTRYDIQRTDHYLAMERDIDRLRETWLGR